MGPLQEKEGFRRNVFDIAALQYPQVFAEDWERYLSEAAAVSPRALGSLIKSEFAWRALDGGQVRRWRDRLERHPVGADRLAQRLDWRRRQRDIEAERMVALFYSKKPPAVLSAWRTLFPAQSDPIAKSWLHQAGYALAEDGLRSLHGERPLHIEFSSAQRKLMTKDSPSWQREIWRAHPTWRANGEDIASTRMGGSADRPCGLCHGPLHRLLSLSVPARVGIRSDTALDFCTCLSCLGWESDGALFYRHDSVGCPSAHPTQRQNTALTPQFPSGPLFEAEVRLFATSERWACQDWGASNDRQNLSRVGGPPSWIQSANYPRCPDCDEYMPFVIQLDSNLPLADGGEWLWGSDGCSYTFWCAGCRVSAHLWQCT